MTKFSTPEELLDPLSAARLKADPYLRLTAGQRHKADGAFIDESWYALGHPDLPVPPTPRGAVSPYTREITNTHRLPLGLQLARLLLE